MLYRGKLGKVDTEHCLPLNKNGRFSIQSAKTDLQKRVSLDREQKRNIWIGMAEFLSWLIVVGCVTVIVWLLFLYPASARAAEIWSNSSTAIGNFHALYRSDTATTEWCNGYFEYTSSTSELSISTVRFGLMTDASDAVDYGTQSITLHVFDGTTDRTSTANVSSFRNYQDIDFYFSPPIETTIGQTLRFSFQDPDDIPLLVGGWRTVGTHRVNSTPEMSNMHLDCTRSPGGSDTSYDKTTWGSPIMTIYGSATDSTMTWPFIGFASSSFMYPWVNAPTSSPEVVQPCEKWTGYQYGFCLLFNWLFVPSTDAKRAYDDYHDLILSKAPLGYFQQAEDAFFSMIHTTTSDFASIEIPTTTINTLTVYIATSVTPILGGAASSTRTIVLLEMDELKENPFVKKMLPYLFTFERLGLWIALLFHVYGRLRIQRVENV